MIWGLLKRISSFGAQPASTPGSVCDTKTVDVEIRQFSVAAESRTMVVACEGRSSSVSCGGSCSC